MATQSSTPRPRFNPTEYREDFEDLVMTNPKLAAESATKLAGKKVRAENQVADADGATRELVGFLGSTLVMGVAGWWMGSMKAKRDALIADWEAEGADSVGASLTDASKPWEHARGVGNPMNWWFIPKLAVLPVGTGLLAMISASMRKAGAAPSGFERTMTISAISTFGLTIASLTGGWSYEAKEKKLGSTVVNSVKGGTQGQVAAA